MIKLSHHKIANKILDRLRFQNEVPTIQNDSKNILKLTQQLNTLTKLLNIAIDKQWLVSAVHLRTRIFIIITDIEYCAKNIEPHTNQVIAGLRDYPTQLQLIEDLKALEQEFGDVFYDKESNEIGVVSRNIIFEDINLGSFELRIATNFLNDARVIACNPNFPHEDNLVTHPHIKENNMCLGEGRFQFHDAIKQGRILDAFLILNSVLKTYNPDGAYVKIDIWEEDPEDYMLCNDCSERIDVIDASTCDCCENDYCDDCIHMCDSCEEIKCAYCINNSCSICKDKRLCEKCVHKCKRCNETFCNECMNDPKETTEEQNCANCQKDIDEGLSIEVRPDCVGQIMLFAG